VELLDDLSTLEVRPFRIAGATWLLVIGTEGVVPSVTPGRAWQKLIAIRRLEELGPIILVAAR
jgi:hypothetical protein